MEEQMSAMKIQAASCSKIGPGVESDQEGDTAAYEKQ